MLQALGVLTVVPVVLFILVAVILVGTFVFRLVQQVRESRAIRRANQREWQ
jgi:Na+-transporting methylmalonyl-CoA/oxaloacetate decarboxylase gamma subunit